MELQKKNKINFTLVLLLINTAAILSLAVWIFFLQTDLNTVLNRFKPKLPEPVPVHFNLSDYTKDLPFLGNPNAKITLILFNSFSCGYCSRIRPVLMELLNNYPNDIKLVHRHHIRGEMDYKYSQAAICAGKQNKFWDMYHAIFQNTGQLQLEINQIAKIVQLDETVFSRCMADKTYRKKLDTETEANLKIGVEGTPSMIIQNKMVSGAYPYFYFKDLIEKELKK